MIKLAILEGLNFQDAEDAADEVMVDIYRRWDGISEHRAYACKSVKNMAQKQDRRNHREDLQGDDINEHRQMACGDPALLGFEDREWVTQCLGALSPRQREVMSYYFDGLSTAEIASLLAVPPPTIRKRLQLARERLRKQLAEQGRLGDDEADPPRQFWTEGGHRGT